MKEFFITQYEIPNVPLFYPEFHFNKKIKHYKVFYTKKKKFYHFFICIPICFRENIILYQEVVYEN
jgi:hypothetical protein